MAINVYGYTNFPFNMKNSEAYEIAPLLFDKEFYRYGGINPSNQSYVGTWSYASISGDYQINPARIFKPSNVTSGKAAYPSPLLLPRNDIFSTSDNWINTNNAGVDGGASIRASRSIASTTGAYTKYGSCAMRTGSEIKYTKEMRVSLDNIRDVRDKKLRIIISRDEISYNLNVGKRTIQYNLAPIQCTILYDPNSSKKITLEDSSNANFYVPKILTCDVSKDSIDRSAHTVNYGASSDDINLESGFTRYTTKGFFEYGVSANTSELINGHSLASGKGTVGASVDSTSGTIHVPVFADHVFNSMAYCLGIETTNGVGTQGPRGYEFKFFTSAFDAEGYQFTTLSDSGGVDEVDIETVGWVDLLTESGLEIDTDCINDSNELVINLTCSANRSQGIHFYHDNSVKVLHWAWENWHKGTPTRKTLDSLKYTISYNLTAFDYGLYCRYGYNYGSHAFINGYTPSSAGAGMLYCAEKSKYSPDDWNPNRSIKIRVEEV